jgi:hypothetical protein
MENRNYSEDKVLRDLSAKHVAFSNNGAIKTLDVTKAQNLGNKSWGKIGFLQHYCGYTLIGKREYSFHEETEKQPIKIVNPIITNQRRILNER